VDKNVGKPKAVLNQKSLEKWRYTLKIITIWELEK